MLSHWNSQDLKSGDVIPGWLVYKLAQGHKPPSDPYLDTIISCLVFAITTGFIYACAYFSGWMR